MIFLSRKPLATMSWEWAMGVGALLIILGAVAIAAPLSMTIGLSWVLGAILLCSGIVQLVEAFRFPNARGRTSHFVLSVLSIGAGAVTMRNPVIGALGITAVITFYLLVGGMSRMMLATDLRPLRGWGFIFVSSLFSFALGIILLVSFPRNSLIVPGLFFGIDLVFYGSSEIGFALDLKRMPAVAQEEEEEEQEQRPKAA